MEKELNQAHKEIAVHRTEQAERAAELVVATKELNFQKKEKKQRAVELQIANAKLLFENEEKENRAQELSIANKELAFQNIEKENRAQELIIANKELAFQNSEKENRAEELIIANKELAIQNREKEKRASQLHSAYKQLEAFNYITSHDLQEPLRKVQMFTSRMLLDNGQELSSKSQGYLNRVNEAALHMQTLIIDLRTYSVASADVGEHKHTDVMEIIQSVLRVFAATINKTNAKVTVTGKGYACVVAFQFQQLIHLLIENAFKFSRAGVPPIIKITCSMVEHDHAAVLLPLKKKYCHIAIADNGIGFDPSYKDQVFEIFKQLHQRQEYSGTGIGLAIAKKIVENHNGLIVATAAVDEGATFDLYIPVDSESSDC